MYSQFDGKADLFLALLTRISERACPACESMPGGDLPSLLDHLHPRRPGNALLSVIEFGTRRPRPLSSAARTPQPTPLLLRHCATC